MQERPVTVVGGGLAGCEAAWALAERGHEVLLVEMRPGTCTPAHQTELLAELVCTNSFKSEDPLNAHGELKKEMGELGSLLLPCADGSRVAAGAALAVDRRLFAEAMTRSIAGHPGIRLVREESREIPPGPAVIATGPLTSDALSTAIRELLGDRGLAFYDAIAPIVSRESIDERIVFAAGRYDQEADYLNCPLSRKEYLRFIEELRSADPYPGHDWEAIPYFEGCLPIEVMAERGPDTLRFGPLKPVGLRDPRTGRRPHAVVQLRREDRAGQMWNLVGFQTRLRHGEQKRVFRRIPGLDRAEFLRYGGIHRNSYLNFPERLLPYGAPPERPDLIFAGQLTGVEGYVESAASGILAGINLARLLEGERPVLPPTTTMLGGLFRYLREASPQGFQPMNSNWGLVDPVVVRARGRRERRALLAARAEEAFRSWVEAEGVAPAIPAPGARE
ncbi:MAG: methylenetetrahydrofolate--tRNA-(uracil(54)-C(5))-methyltransferase (FADH(2)-oxidizing) TrmFO [Gemmatimonadota bacterium]